MRHAHSCCACSVHRKRVRGATFMCTAWAVPCKGGGCWCCTILQGCRCMATACFKAAVCADRTLLYELCHQGGIGVRRSMPGAASVMCGVLAEHRVSTGLPLLLLLLHHQHLLLLLAGLPLLVVHLLLLWLGVKRCWSPLHGKEVGVLGITCGPACTATPLAGC